jgi:hypothetical protein
MRRREAWRAEYNDPDLKKLLATAFWAAAALGAAVGALSLPWRAESPAPAALEASCSGRGALEAGAAEEPLDLPAPLVAGFFKMGWRADGVRDPVAVRALVAAEPGCAVGLVSADILLVPGNLQRAVAERTADLGLSQVVVAATHTHAGPGGYWDSALGARLATGPYDGGAFAAVVEASVRALRRASAARRPARLSAAAVDAPDLVLNRTGAEPGGRLVSLRFQAPDAAPIAEVVVLGSHATMLGPANRRISGDWPGALARRAPAPLLFFQGALGDQTTYSPPEEGWGPEQYAAAVGERIAAAPRSAADDRPALAAARAAVPLPLPWPGGAPRWLRPAARTLFGGALPSEARVVAVRLGGVLLLAVPAEPVEAVAREWRGAMGPEAQVLALAGDYLGYVETRARTAMGAGEASRTYYGPGLASRLREALELAARAAR